jgi:hypothetical protein
LTSSSHLLSTHRVGVVIMIFVVLLILDVSVNMMNVRFDFQVTSHARVSV